MKILVDSREKEHAIAGIIAYFDRHGIEWERVKLDVGDYMVDGKPGIVVDRKQNLNEMANNLLSPDRARFYREIRRARDDGIRLVILCEHGPNVKSLADVRKWVPKYGKVSGRSLADAIFRLEMAYGVETVFCGKKSTGKEIVRILTGEEVDKG